MTRDRGLHLQLMLAQCLQIMAQCDILSLVVFIAQELLAVTFYSDPTNKYLFSQFVFHLYHAPNNGGALDVEDVLYFVLFMITSFLFASINKANSRFFTAIYRQTF